MVTISHERFRPADLFSEVLCFCMCNFVYKSILIACRLLLRRFSQETIASRILWNFSVLSTWKCFLFLLCCLLTLNPTCSFCVVTISGVRFSFYLLANGPSALILDPFPGCPTAGGRSLRSLTVWICKAACYIRSYVPAVYKHCT